MKRLIILLVFISTHLLSQNKIFIQDFSDEYYLDDHNHLSFVKIRSNKLIKESETENFINGLISEDASLKIELIKSEIDELGYTHKRYKLLSNGINIHNRMIVAHFKNKYLESLNGDLYASKISKNQFIINEPTALNYALNKVKAEKYKWENKAEEEHEREATGLKNFTYYPKAKKVLFEINGVLVAAYQFEIYAEIPLYKANVFVDANNGKILAEQNLICTVDVAGTASTRYSGTQTITCDQQSTNSYRLREVQRGLGVETYNMNNTTSYLANDFTNTSTSWTTTGVDQAATDAHWGAEKTYDYFMMRFNRNSIDNMGYKLRSYVHYGNNFNNAFWDGTRMTYGDGNGTLFTILTAVDVCGHEITHGLVSRTAGLNGGGSGEADALNEAFADIFGTSIERYARPSNYNWIMGSDITPSGSGIRNMQNPKSLNDPDTYGGLYWDNAGEPHNNAGPAIKWFYLLVNGGAATNDLNNAYNVSGIGNLDAERIAYRALTVYFSTNTNYAAARLASIQAAKDLFGPCANQVVQTANAWYAVGVGAQFLPNQIAPDFITSNTSYCTLPASMIFTNTTSNGLNYIWDFGDGSAASTATNAFHTYTVNGTFNVKLKVFGCNNVQDSIIKNAYVNINVPSYPAVASATICENTSAILTASANATIKWFANNAPISPLYVGNTFTSPPLNQNTIYYVANTITNSAVFGGRQSNTNGGFISSANNWLTFDVVQSGILNSVVMYAQTAGNRFIELRNATSNLVNSAVVNLSVGANTVVLNFPLAIGNNYQLGLTNNSNGNLYRSSSGNNYPYNIGGCVNITGSSAGTGFYYWFYNWSVTKDDCYSALAPVYVNVLTPIPSTIAVPSLFVCKDDAPVVPTATPSGGTFSGIGVTSAGFNPNIGTGVYYINYASTDANGCQRTDSIEMQVTECVGLNNYSKQPNFMLYPNPSHHKLCIQQNNFSAKKAVITDMQGRVILSETLQSDLQKVNLEHLSKGLYIISLQDENKKVLYSGKLMVE